MQVNKQRIGELDFLRGIALFGILLLNVQVFSTSIFITDQWLGKYPNSLDSYVFRTINLLVSQRFIGIFSFLFGLGVAIQQQSFKKLNLHFTNYYFKRASLFALFGIINILFLFWADILFIYGLFSILLFFFMGLSNRTILITAFLVFFIPTLLYCIPSISAFFEQSSVAMHKYYTADEFIKIFQSGTFFQMMKARISDYLNSYLPDIIWHRTSFAFILLGFYVGRNNLHITYLKYWREIKLFFYIVTPLCVIYIVGDYIWEYFYRSEVVFVLLKDVFIIITIFIYIIIILVAYHSKFLNNKISVFANIGKLSLSNYFLQQLICAFIFHNYGLSLYFETSPVTNLLIALGIFTFQLVISNLYLKNYNMGPLEGVWRKLSR